MNSEAIIAKLKAVPGNVGFYYKDLTSGETLGYNENEQFEAASVIKLPVYMVIMKLAHEGKLSLSEKLTCHHADKMPPCGALYFFTDEPVVDIETLCGLMITISDNTATNMLISHLGIDFLNEEFQKDRPRKDPYRAAAVRQRSKRTGQVQLHCACRDGYAAGAGIPPHVRFQGSKRGDRKAAA